MVYFVFYFTDADIITVYVGRYTDEIDVKMMREITSEDKEITVDDFSVTFK